jgi:hypothetical protein
MFFRLEDVSKEMSSQVNLEDLRRNGVIIIHYSSEPRLVVDTDQGPYIYVGNYQLSDAKSDLLDMLKNPIIEMCPAVRVKAVKLLIA